MNVPAENFEFFTGPAKPDPENVAGIRRILAAPIRAAIESDQLLTADVVRWWKQMNSNNNVERAWGTASLCIMLRELARDPANRFICDEMSWLNMVYLERVK